MNQVVMAYEWDSSEYYHNKHNSLSNGYASKNEYEYVRSNNDKLFIRAESFPEIDTGVVFKHIVDLLPDEIYCYSIPIKSYINYFKKKFINGFHIHPRVLKDIREGRALLVLDFHWEGHLIQNLQEFHSTISKLKLPRERVLLLHANFHPDTHYNTPYYIYEPVDVFPSWIRKSTSDGIIRYEPEHLYLSYNRVLGGRFHRQLLLVELYKRNLFDRGIISIGKDMGKNDLIRIASLDKTIKVSEIEGILKYVNSSPDNNLLDTTNNNKLTFNVDRDFHEKTFVSLVSETLYFPGMDFFSEKIYKPLSIGHPFIINGTAHSLRRLKNMGFKTFSNWWDESYDDIEDYINRVYAIVDIIERLSKKSTAELRSYRSQMRSTLDHNMKLYDKLRLKCVGEHPAITAIKKHLNRK